MNSETLFYKGKKDTYNFQKFDKIRSFYKNIFCNKITLDDADKDQVELSIKIID